jgi:hypothetical protein
LAAGNPDPATLNCILCNAGKSDALAICALAISVLVLVLQVASFFLTNFRNRKKDLSAKVDEAWFKSIVLDDCLPELQKFCATQRSKFEELARSSSQTVARHVTFISQFNAETESLQRKIAMTECMSVKALQLTVLEIEELGDSVATNASKVMDSGNSPDERETALLATMQAFDRRSANCLHVWKRLHHALQHGENPDLAVSNDDFQKDN